MTIRHRCDPVMNELTSTVSPSSSVNSSAGNLPFNKYAFLSMRNGQHSIHYSARHSPPHLDRHKRSAKMFIVKTVKENVQRKANQLPLSGELGGVLYPSRLGGLTRLNDEGIASYASATVDQLNAPEPWPITQN